MAEPLERFACLDTVMRREKYLISTIPKNPFASRKGEKSRNIVWHKIGVFRCDENCYDFCLFVAWYAPSSVGEPGLFLVAEFLQVWHAGEVDHGRGTAHEHEVVV